MNREDVWPPGDGPRDPYVKDLDAIAFALSRLRTHLFWIGEHFATFQAIRITEPDRADQELADLADSHRQVMKHLARSTGLLLAGYSIDPQKRIPDELLRWLANLDAATLRPVWLTQETGPSSDEGGRPAVDKPDA